MTIYLQDTLETPERQNLDSLFNYYDDDGLFVQSVEDFITEERIIQAKTWIDEGRKLPQYMREWLIEIGIDPDTGKDSE